MKNDTISKLSHSSEVSEVKYVMCESVNFHGLWAQDFQKDVIKLFRPCLVTTMIHIFVQRKLLGQLEKKAGY